MAATAPVIPEDITPESEEELIEPGVFAGQIPTRSVNVDPGIVTVPGRNERPATGHRIVTEVAIETPSVSDGEQIQRMIEDFFNNRIPERDLEVPTYLRHKVALFDIPMFPEGEIVRYRLSD